MAPDNLRNGWGFARFSGLSVGLAALVTATPALAQGLASSSLMGAAPLAIALGAGAFGLIATALVRRLLRDRRLAESRAADQIAMLRARLDEYEALLSGSREIIVLWGGDGSPPRFLGQASALLPPGRRADAALDFTAWLGPSGAGDLAQNVQELRATGRTFEITVRARDGHLVRATGTGLGNGVVLRLRPAATVQGAVPAPPPEARPADARPLLDGFIDPAWLRDDTGELVYANAAYHELARTLGRHSTEDRPAELLDIPVRRKDREAATPQGVPVSLGRAGDYDLIEVPYSDGAAGFLHPRPVKRDADSGLNHLSAIIDALTTPIAIFNAGRELVQFNRAYCALWGLDPEWLQLGMDERAILDKLRTDGKLPNEPDYHAWRASHLASYQLKVPRELKPWYLPDGRVVQIIAAPAGAMGGVIYVFEDITDQLNLKSQHRAVLDVQRSTLNSLSEAVAVFGTNGRLTLSNPRLSSLWKIPANLLAEQPHIDAISAAVAQAMPEDGAGIWRDLKQSIIDLNPTRSDRQGRLTRADGKLIDYAVVRLPDGQSLMTFLDVTESANYQRVLKERNEALITADRLKDAFVQNVSYELRSPLTNIIGFADLLASGVVGELNERQHSYTDYIRASSVTLGVLIDNILDIANVDAGIAELRPEPQDIAQLVEKARAGLAATFPEVEGETSLNLTVKLDDDLPPFIADGTRIVQVLYNLLSNAARFSEPGGEVHLTVTGRSGRIQFIVEDEGAAMPDDVRAALTDRTDSAAAARQRGAGLGLVIVKSFVNMHGGTISIERREPRGSRVVVSLPSDASMAGAAE